MVFGSAIQKEEDNKHMTYWLSATSTADPYDIPAAASPPPNITMAKKVGQCVRILIFSAGLSSQMSLKKMEMANHLVKVEGQLKSTLLRYDHIGMFLEALTECGVSSYCVYTL